MGTLDDLTRLTDTAADSPPYDGRELFRSVRRRRRRRIAASGVTGTFALVLLVTAIWSGSVPSGDLFIDDMAGTDGASPELPAGWQRIDVAAGSLAVPGEWTIRELGVDDPPPCDHGHTAYVITGGWPAATHTPGGVLHACDMRGNTRPLLLAAPIREVPDSEQSSALWTPTTIGGHPAEQHITPPRDRPNGARDVADDLVVADRIARYRIPRLDLYLQFTSTEAHTELIEAVLATVSARTTEKSAEPVAESTQGALPNMLPIPQIGSAAASYLDDGTPVFISHAEEGTVRILDALDRRGGMVAFCPQVRLLIEPRDGSTYQLDGTYAGGPSPADLSQYPAELTDDGNHVVVTGAREPSAGRSAEQSEFPSPRCDDAVTHEPDTSHPEHTLHEAVPDDGT